MPVRARSAVSGRFVKLATALRRPREAVLERRRAGRDAELEGALRLAEQRARAIAELSSGITDVARSRCAITGTVSADDLARANLVLVGRPALAHLERLVGYRGTEQRGRR